MHKEAIALLKGQIQAHRSMIDRCETEKTKLLNQVKFQDHSINVLNTRILELEGTIDTLYEVPAKPFTLVS